jgi:hypothetical protein
MSQSTQSTAQSREQNQTYATLNNIIGTHHRQVFNVNGDRILLSRVDNSDLSISGYHSEDMFFFQIDRTTGEIKNFALKRGDQYLMLEQEQERDLANSTIKYLSNKDNLLSVDTNDIRKLEKLLINSTDLSVIDITKQQIYHISLKVSEENNQVKIYKITAGKTEITISSDLKIVQGNKNGVSLSPSEVKFNLDPIMDNIDYELKNNPNKVIRSGKLRGQNNSTCPLTFPGGFQGIRPERISFPNIEG